MAPLATSTTVCGASQSSQARRNRSEKCTPVRQSGHPTDERSATGNPPPHWFRANPDGSAPTKLATLPDGAFYLSWSPDGKRIRFSAGDSKSAGYFLWQADLSSNTVDRFIPNLSAAARPWAGGWTPDGLYFFYSAMEDGVRNIYAIRERND